MFMEVEVATWRALLDANGEQARLSGKAFSHQELIASLVAGDIAPEFYSALEIVQELGTDDGRAHIQQLANEQSISLPVSASDLPAREFAAQLILRRAGEQKINELLQVAQLSLRSVESPRKYREYVGKTTPTEAKLNAQKLKAAIESWCRDHQKNDVVTVQVHLVNEEWYCQIVRGDDVKRVMEVKGQAIVPLQYRPAATDLLRFDPKTGRIGIATRYGQMIQGYRAVLGSCLAGDEQFFAGENICSLRPLEEQRGALFAEDRLPLGIRRIDTVELLWRRGERDKVWVRGRDCFKVLDDLEAKLQEGEIAEARLLVHFSVGGRPGQVVLKIPNIIDIKAGGREALVERFLDSVRLRGSFADDGAPRTFWGLFPWRLKEAEWRRRLGSSFDELVGRRTLRPISLAAVSHPGHTSGVALEVVGTEGGALIGASEDEAVGVRMLTSSDIEGYQLEPADLAQEIQQKIGLQGECRELSNGLWCLGQRTFQLNRDIAVFLCLRQPNDAVAAVVDTEAKTRGTAVVLYPECGHNPVAPGAGVACRLPHGPYDDVVEKIVVQLGWQASVPANIWSSADLILDSAKGLGWYRGTALDELRPDTHAFKFAAAVAKAGGNVVSKNDLNSLLSANRSDDEPAKKAKSGFIKAVRASFKAKGLSSPPEIGALFRAIANGYALQGTAKVLE
ncbi:MAG: hypothetical protein WDO72_12035 [Pseudomonadota bacterium]